MSSHFSVYWESVSVSCSIEANIFFWLLLRFLFVCFWFSVVALWYAQVCSSLICDSVSFVSFGKFLVTIFSTNATSPSSLFHSFLFFFSILFLSILPAHAFSSAMSNLVSFIAFHSFFGSYFWSLNSYLVKFSILLSYFVEPNSYSNFKAHACPL